MRDISQEDVKRFADRLANWPSNGKPEMDDDVFMLQQLGFVEEQEQKKACKTCGTPRVDYRWLKVTPAGHFFMVAALGRHPWDDRRPREIECSAAPMPETDMIGPD